MAMKGINFMRRQAWLLLALWAVQGVSAAQVCTTNGEGKTVCHNKLSPGAIAAIVVTGVLVILICAGIYYVLRRTRAHRMNNTLSNTFVIPALGYSSSRNRRRDEEEGESDEDDEKYLSVEKNQIHGPAWEARYDPSSAPIPGSAPLPGHGSGSWSSRLRNLKSGGLHSSDYGQQPMSAPGHGHGRMGVSGSQSASVSSSVKKPRSAGADPSSMVSKGGKRHHWGNLIHGSSSGSGSRSKSGSKSAGTTTTLEPAKQARTRASPGLQIIASGPGGYNSPIIPPIAPHTPRTPSRLGTAPPLSAGPAGEGFTSAPITPRTAGMATPLTPRPVPAYSPVTPRGHMGAI